MSSRPQATWLPDGKRLHLHHGPIDLIIGADGPDRSRCFHRAVACFDGVLDALVPQLAALRAPVADTCFSRPVAQRMQQAVRPHSAVFVTPMAAVAGAVADHVLTQMVYGLELSRAYVNNGGDIAFHLTTGARFTALGPAGEIAFDAQSAARGVATSGWSGRSFSRGIADGVTVAARTAAAADVAATLIANAVDLPGHPGVQRVPASSLSPDSDLGARLVTRDVAALSADDCTRALRSGMRVAAQMRDAGVILDAVAQVQGHVLTLEDTVREVVLSA